MSYHLDMLGAFVTG